MLFTLLSSPMAPFSAHMSSLFLLLLFLLPYFSSIHTQARESTFFSKTTRPRSEPPATRSVDVDPFPGSIPEGEHGYGLYGHYNTQKSSPATATATAAGTYNYDTQYSTEAVPSTDEFGGSEAFEMKEFNPGYNNNRKYYNYYGGNKGQQYGMSDTRFMENGKYFYDVNAEKERGGGYGGSYIPQGYGEENGRERENAYHGSNDDNKKYMEGYQEGKYEYEPVP